MTFGARTLGYLRSPTTALSTTLTIGTATAGAGLNLRGFTSIVLASYAPTTFGSLASATLTDGKTCTQCYDDRDTTTPMYIAVFSISGFSSDPGQGYLYDVTANGVTKLGSLATFYSYSAGRAMWNWEAPTTINLFGFAVSGTTPLVIRIN
jgi:hypothetical protein